MDTKIIHLLIRFSDNLFGIGNVIGKHQKVIEEFGAVWFGKMGSPVAINHIDRINQQCESDISSFVYLVKGNRRKSTAYRGKIASLSRDVPITKRT